MKNFGWLSRFLNQQPSPATVRRVAAGSAIAFLLLISAAAFGQNATQTAPAPETQMSIPAGYSVHQSVDVGGRVTNLVGSGAMYDTMVNAQSGPRVLGETFEMHALPGNKGTFADDLRAFSSGFGGDPDNFAKLDISKSKYYEFSGMFRRDRQYFDYDLLGNPNIPGGQSIPIGPTATPTGSLAVQQVTQSPFLFNTVRRMTDTDLTLLPMSKLTFRVGYSQNVMQGPSLSPSGFWEITSPVFLFEDLVLSEYQRNSSDNFTGAVDWKPVANTRLTFEEEITHYKANSYFTPDQAYFNVQEADGTPVALLTSYDTLSPYASNSCNANSMGGSPMLTASSNSSPLPVINAACAVMSSYLRTQPTRVIFPTEIFRLQSSSIRNLAMNGDLRYTDANMSMPSYSELFQGLSSAAANGALRSLGYTASASAKREVIAADYGVAWQVTHAFRLSEQLNFSNAQEPGTTKTTGATALTTPTVAGDETINYNGALTPRTPGIIPGNGPIGTPEAGFFGQKFFINNLTGTWDVTAHTAISLTYRYSDHVIAESQGNTPHNVPIPANGNTYGTVTIHENGGILNVAMHPANHWDLNGSAELAYADNVFTPVAPRQLQRYRVHTLYRPRPWATLSGSFSDLERHNNTNNNQSITGNTVVYAGPLDHIDHSRFVNFGADLQPNEHFGFSFSYSYSDVYTSTNICYDAASSAAYPGAATASGLACPQSGPDRGVAYYDYGPVKDFMDAPSQSGTAALTLSPDKKLRSDIGYSVTSVNGSQFFNDPRAVNGSLVSTYQSPYVNLAWTMHPGLIWKAQYNFFGYGEGGPSGAALCSTTNPTPTTPAPGVPCASLAGMQTGLTISPAGETAPRNYHANNVLLGVHYEF